MHRTGRPEDSPIAGYQLPLFMLYRPDFRRLPCTRRVDSLLPSFLLPVHADSPRIHTGTLHAAQLVKSPLSVMLKYIYLTYLIADLYISYNILFLISK